MAAKKIRKPVIAKTSWEPRVRPQIHVTKAFADEQFDGTFRLTLKLKDETEPCEIAHVYEPVDVKP